jgi:hypothetical protein
MHEKTDADDKRRQLVDELDRIEKSRETADLRDSGSLDVLAARLKQVRQQLHALDRRKP